MHQQFGGVAIIFIAPSNCEQESTRCKVCANDAILWHRRADSTSNNFKKTLKSYLLNFDLE